MRAILVALFLSVGILRAQTPDSMLMHCEGSEKLSPDEMLLRLGSFADTGDDAATECLFAYMQDLSRARDKRVLPFIASNLDLSNPRSRNPGPGAHPGHGVLFGGQFPAIEYIVSFKTEALPVIAQTIAGQPGLTLKAKNAVLAWMVIEAPDPPRGVQLLVEAADKASGASAKTLSLAAQFATTTWQCHLILSKCDDALASRQKPIPPEAKPQ